MPPQYYALLFLFQFYHTNSLFYPLFDSGIFGHADGFKVENIVDTVGAGDGFAAGLLASLFDGYSFRESVIRANGVGAMQLLSPSDNEGLPTVSELEDFIESHK